MRVPLRERIFDWIIVTALVLGLCLLALVVLAMATALGETWGLWELGMVG